MYGLFTYHHWIVVDKKLKQLKYLFSESPRQINSQIIMGQ